VHRPKILGAGRSAGSRPQRQAVPRAVDEPRQSTVKQAGVERGGELDHLPDENGPNNE